MSMLRKLTEIEKIRLPVTCEDFIASLSAQGDRNASLPGETCNTISRIYRKTPNRFIMYTKKMIEFFHEGRRIRNCIMWNRSYMSNDSIHVLSFINPLSRKSRGEGV